MDATERLASALFAADIERHYNPTERRYAAIQFRQLADLLDAGQAIDTRRHVGPDGWRAYTLQIADVIGEPKPSTPCPQVFG